MLAVGFGVQVNGQLIYPNKSINPQEYGGGRDVWYIDQASDGTMYFGTSSALVRYKDGRWESEQLPGELAIYSIAVSDDQNRIYIGSGGQFGYFTEDLTFKSLSDSLDAAVSEFGTIWNINITSHGVYFRSTKYLFRLHNESLSVIHAFGNSRRPFDITVNVNDTIYTHIREVGIAKVYDGKLEVLEGISFDYKCNGFLPHPKGLLIATRYDGLFLYKDGVVKPFSTDADEHFKEHHIFQAELLHDGLYAFATLSGGLVITNNEGSIVHQVSSENYNMKHETVRDVFEDASNGLWLGMATGIMYIDRSSPMRYYQFDELDGYTDFSLFNGRLYFGTDKGLFSCTEDGIDLKHVRGTANLCAEVIVCDQKLFASNFDLGITYQVVENQATEILQGTGWAIAKKSQEGEFVAKLHEDVYYLEEKQGRWSVIHKLENIPFNVVDMVDYPEGFAGVSISTGLFTYHDSLGLKLYDLEHARSIKHWKEQLLVTTQDAFYRLNPATDQLQSFAEFNDRLPASTSRVQGLYASGDTTWLLYFNNKILTGDVYASDQHIKKLPLFGVYQGDPVVVELMKEKLFIGANENIILYDLSVASSVGDPLQAVISPSDSEGQMLPYSTDPLKFSFSGNNMNAFGENFYRYRMDGYNEKWSSWSTQNYLEIANLSEGDYKLRLQVMTPSREEAATVLSFTILPPWFRTWWAYLIYLIGGLSVVLGYIRYTNRRIRLRNLVLLKNKEAEQLRELDKMKSSFFANISHELRTPLTLAKGNIENTLNNKEAGSTDRYLKNSQRSLNQLSVMIEDLLDLSKFELGKYQLKKHPVQINQLLLRICGSFESMLHERDIQLAFTDQTKKRRHCELDQKQFEKVISNLIYNAYKFSKKGGIIRVNLLDSNDHAIIEVADEGVGMPPEELPHIFDRFYQVDNQPSQAQGSGLGLTIVKEITELHGGTIEVESREHLGTTFFISLPIIDSSKIPDEENKQEEQQTVDDIITQKLTKGRVVKPRALIVEDNLDMQEYLEEVMSKYFDVTVRSNGKEALEWIGHNKASLVISDVMMPEMDGFEFLSRVKERVDLKNIPFILLTAKASHEDLLTGLRLGVDDYLTKPFDQDELLIRAVNLVDNLQNRMKWQNEIEEENEQSDEHISKEDEALVQRMKEYIMSRISDTKISVADMADEAALSERQIYRRLSVLTGFSPAQFIMEIRLLHARDLLLSGGIIKLSQLAIAVGIGTPAYLSKMYYERFGKRPTHYFDS